MSIYGFDKNKCKKEVCSKDDFATIYGSITTPEAGSDVINAHIDLNYPEGFNKDNCVIISLMADPQSLANRSWKTTGATGKSAEIGYYGLRASMNKDNISVYLYKVDVAENSRKSNIRLVLMKLPEYIEGFDYILGDINGDGKVNNEDLDLIQDYLLGKIALNSKQFAAADVNKDGIINTSDMLQIQKYILGAIDEI